MAIIGFIATLQQFSPKISLSPGPTVDPHNPFLTGFVLSNDGMLPIYNIHKRMLIERADGANGVGMENVQFHDTGEYPKLNAGRKTTIQVPRGTYEMIFAPNNALMPTSFSSAQIVLYISYRPMLFLNRVENAFRFSATTNSVGDILWTPLEYKFSPSTNGNILAEPMSK